jgi:hypothetical protein
LGSYAAEHATQHKDDCNWLQIRITPAKVNRSLTVCLGGKGSQILAAVRERFSLRFLCGNCNRRNDCGAIMSAMTDLFAAAKLDKDAPHPLADRLRPRRLSDVAGQDHLLGPDGALTRLIRSGSLGSLVFWGPPGTGKTTVARLLAHETKLAFVQISAIFSGVADLKKTFEAARAPADKGRCCSWTRFTGSIARSRIRSCR